MSKVIVAVYGSLKKGHGNHRLLADAEFINTGETKEKFEMVSFGAFPGLIEVSEHSKNPAIIRVEVYQVDTERFKALDRLEGYPNFYTRRQITIKLDDDKEIQAWIYILNRPLNTYEHTVSPVDGKLCW